MGKQPPQLSYQDKAMLAALKLAQEEERDNDDYYHIDVSFKRGGHLYLRFPSQVLGKETHLSVIITKEGIHGASGWDLAKKLEAKIAEMFPEEANPKPVQQRQPYNPETQKGALIGPGDSEI